MKILKNERGFTMLYTLFIILFLTFIITFSFNQNFHLQMMTKNDHNIARVEYYVFISIHYLQQLYKQDEQIDAGLFSISNQTVQFQLYKENVSGKIWRLSLSLDNQNKSFLLTMNKESLDIVSWIQLE